MNFSLHTKMKNGKNETILPYKIQANWIGIHSLLPFWYACLFACLLFIFIHCLFEGKLNVHYFASKPFVFVIFIILQSDYFFL